MRAQDPSEALVHMVDVDVHKIAAPTAHVSVGRLCKQRSCVVLPPGRLVQRNTLCLCRTRLLHHREYYIRVLLLFGARPARAPCVTVDVTSCCAAPCTLLSQVRLLSEQ